MDLSVFDKLVDEAVRIHKDGGDEAVFGLLADQGVEVATMLTRSVVLPDKSILLISCWESRDGKFDPCSALWIGTDGRAVEIPRERLLPMWDAFLLSEYADAYYDPDFDPDAD